MCSGIVYNVDQLLGKFQCDWPSSSRKIELKMQRRALMADENKIPDDNYVFTSWKNGLMEMLEKMESLNSIHFEAKIIIPIFFTEY